MATEENRTNQKFTVRFDDDSMRKSIEDASDEIHISMNAFILQAIDEKMERGRYLDVLLQAAAKTLL